jgi:hypothetical protein
LSRVDARRIAIRAQLLDAPRPSDLVSVVRRLTLLQIDPTAAVAPNADLVAWSRLGSSYRAEHLPAAVERDRTLFEHSAFIRPAEDLPLYLAGAGSRPHSAAGRAWLSANDGFRRDVLELLAASGPLPSRGIPDTSTVPWPSSGWTNNRNVTQMLEMLERRAEVAVSGRRGRERVWDLAERVHPSVVTDLPEDEAQRLRDARRLQALGIARATGTAMPNEPATVGQAGEPAVVDGVPGEWRVDPDQLGRPFAGRTALLSPFDRLVHDRTRALELFDFEYTLEMYKPKAARRWGYFALPVLHGDRLVGKLDATADRRAGALVVHAVHEDVPFTAAMADDVRREIDDLAGWLGLDVTLATDAAPA